MGSIVITVKQRFSLLSYCLRTDIWIDNIYFSRFYININDRFNIGKGLYKIYAYAFYLYCIISIYYEFLFLNIFLNGISLINIKKMFKVSKQNKFLSYFVGFIFIFLFIFPKQFIMLFLVNRLRNSLAI